MKTNEELLAEANNVEFKFMKNGRVNSARHTKYELGLYAIKRAIERHGIDRYKYGLVQYDAALEKVQIICPEHGPFFQTPNDHIRGKGCQKCAGNITLTTEEWVARAKKVHDDLYDYSHVVYKSAHKNVSITCHKHGQFQQSPVNHLSGQGCPSCASEASAKRQSHTTEQFIIKANSVHVNSYDYSKVCYKNSREVVQIICPEHGSFFQTPNNHLRGQGCAKCSGKHVPTTEEWISKARLVHGDKYDYSNVVYIKAHDKIEIVCPLHGGFLQSPTNHLECHGCPKCGGNNHDILYLLKCMNTGWYKIGITTGDTKRRLQQIGGNIEEVYYVNIEDPRKHETHLHRKYAKGREYNLYVDSGNTEFFSLTEQQVQEVINYMKELK